jgi:hypothetical protein
MLESKDANTVSLKTPEVAVHERAFDWKPRAGKGLAASLALAALDVSIPLSAIYRYTPLGA